MNEPLRPLRPHQVEAVNWLQGRRRAALFMEMRLGKTLTTIRFLSQETEKYERSAGAFPILVVAPLTVLTAWENELRLEGETFLNVHKLDKEQLVSKVQQFAKGCTRCWVLINYEKLRTCPRLALLYWFGVILDESTKIRNPKAQITKVCLAGFGNATYRLILSGLPAPESLLDFYSQMSFLKPNWLGCRNYWEFRQRFFHLSYYDWLPDPQTPAVVRSQVAEDAFWLRRSDVRMGGQKVYERRTVEKTALQKALQKQARAEWQLEEKQATNILTVMTWLSQIAGGFHPETTDCISNAKTEALLELLQGDLRRESVVVWFRFLREMDWVQAALLSKGIIPGRIDGSQNYENRSQILESFQAGKTEVLLCQEKCGKFGLNLSRSQTAIYYSNDWSLEDRVQSEDRIVGSSPDPLLVIDLVTEGTLDEKLLGALLQKKLNAREFSSKVRELVLDFLAERS